MIVKRHPRMTVGTSWYIGQPDQDEAVRLSPQKDKNLTKTSKCLSTLGEDLDSLKRILS